LTDRMDCIRSKRNVDTDAPIESILTVDVEDVVSNQHAGVTCERATFSECLGQHEIKTPVGCSSRQSSSKVLAIIGQVEASDWLNRETQRGAHSLGQKVELHASPEISTSIAETDIHKWSVVVERNSSVWNLCGND